VRAIHDRPGAIGFCPKADKGYLQARYFAISCGVEQFLPGITNVNPTIISDFGLKKIFIKGGLPTPEVD
jgi:hypothetical protein